MEEVAGHVASRKASLDEVGMCPWDLDWDVASAIRLQSYRTIR